MLCLYGGLKEENSKWSVQRRLKSQVRVCEGVLMGYQRPTPIQLTSYRLVAQTYPCCVGTPSRVLDFVKSKVLDLTRVSFFVMDEYDQLMGKGFFKNVKAIASLVPRQAVRCGVR